MTTASGAVMALPRWQRRAIYLSVCLLAGSGIGWLLTAWPDTSASPAVRSAALWFLRLHGVAAYALLTVVGGVFPVHVRLGWNRHRNRWSGAALLSLMLLLATTGLWLYYGAAAGRDTVSTVHWGFGLAMPMWLLLHRAWGLRGRAPARS